MRHQPAAGSTVRFVTVLPFRGNPVSYSTRIPVPIGEKGITGVQVDSKTLSSHFPPEAGLPLEPVAGKQGKVEILHRSTSDSESIAWGRPETLPGSVAGLTTIFQFPSVLGRQMRALVDGLLQHLKSLRAFAAYPGDRCQCQDPRFAGVRELVVRILGEQRRADVFQVPILLQER